MIRKVGDRYAIPPGETIKELMGYHMLTHKDLCEKLSMDNDTLTMLLEGDIAIDVATARKLKDIFGCGISFWLNLDKIYQNKIYRIN